ncbi:MAG: alpha/beta hydrolase [Clostridiales bacterium]|uniref:alpha/beta hydrolase n=1 Tax=Terrisporobacter sp. TaxID=1965305 RepID=UPI002A51BB18|nr:alpha/beta hydrolase [Terrisporobacter sp.]MDD7755820.1 alpha/beta hydrolase [Clostridiales bacterium]MDY4135980.1 alpha/beta hydrolase [Terrisporobacter sp.]
MKRFKKITISIFIVLLTLFIGGSSLVGVLFYNLALNANYSKDIIYAEYNDENLNDAQKWLEEKSNYSDKYIESYDKLQLHSYVVSQNSNKWAIVVHGYGGSGKLMSDKSKYFYDMGYNVLIPDLRGHGKSEGDYIGMGWKDRLDIISWINFIIKENPNAEIVLHGTSMGAATVLMTSGENLPSNVKAIVADCAYTSAWDEFSYQLETYLKVPSYYILNVTNMVTKLKAGYSLKEASALESVKKATVPILFIHGDKDKFVPYSMMDKLYDATNSPKEKLTIEGGEHANSDLVSPFLYWLTVEDFLNQYVTQ